MICDFVVRSLDLTYSLWTDGRDIAHAGMETPSAYSLQAVSSRLLIQKEKA